MERDAAGFLVPPVCTAKWTEENWKVWRESFELHNCPGCDKYTLLEVCEPCFFKGFRS